MAKYLNRYAARLAVSKLKESNRWIAKRHMLLETDEGDLEIKAGDPVILGATEKGELAIKDPQAVVVIADDAVASKVVDSITNSADLSDVEFLDRPALDSALEGTDVETIVSGLMDADEGEAVETAVVSTDDDKTVEEKCNQIAENTISDKDAICCERAYFEDEAADTLPVADIKEPATDVLDFANYDEYASKISELGGSVQPGDKEIALNAEGAVIGYFDKNTNEGKIYPTVTFASEDEMSDFEAGQTEDARSITANGAELDDSCCSEEVEEALAQYEESARSVKDLNILTESLSKAGVKDEMFGKIANTFVKHGLKEGVNVFDTKLGKVVASFSERVDADNYIAESGEEVRFTKRFFG